MSHPFRHTANDHVGRQRKATDLEDCLKRLPSKLEDAFEVKASRIPGVNGIGVFTKRAFKVHDPLMTEKSEPTWSFKINDGCAEVASFLDGFAEAKLPYVYIRAWAEKYNQYESIINRTNVYFAAYPNLATANSQTFVVHAATDLPADTELTYFYGFSYWLKQLWFRYASTSVSMKQVLGGCICEYVSLYPESIALFNTIIRS